MKKEPKMKYTDMCIYIDKWIYTDNYDADIIFDYLYKLFYALSYKKKFFNSIEDYKNYSIYGATQTFLRLTNPKQFLPDDDPKKLPKIKSVLNFIKKILYPARVNYQQEAFNKIIDSEVQGNDAVDAFKEYSSRSISDQHNPLIQIEVENCLSSIPRTLKKFLEDSPYSSDNVTLNNIYTSCLITLLRSITMSNYNKTRLYSKGTDNYRLNIDELLVDIYKQEAANSPITWHLPRELTEYINVVCNQLKHLIAKDIKHICMMNEIDTAVFEDLLINPGDNKDVE